MKIDSHQHYWHYTSEDYGWIGDSMSAIRRDFLPGEFASVLKQNGIDGSIAVQARQTEEETSWLLELTDQHPHILGVVGWIDLKSANAGKLISDFANHPKAAGLRHVIHDEPDINFMLNKEFLRGVEMLNKFNLTYDLLIFPDHLPNTLKFINQFPAEQLFVIDHVAKPLIKTGALSPWKEYMQEIARHPNVFCKLSGMVTEANWPHQQPDDFKPYFDVVFEAFGPDRLMFGSDWPVCLVAEEYAGWLKTVIDAISVFSSTDQKKIMGLNALQAYHLK